MLQKITSDNSMLGVYIAKFIDFFESKDAYYLVQEYVGDMTMDVFVRTAFDLMNQKKLSWRDYYKVVKFLGWQMSAVVHWLHTGMNVAHLDLSPSNIMVVNAGFEYDAVSKQYQINGNIQIKIVGFSVSEPFKFGSDDARIVTKNCLRESYSHVAPEVFEDKTYEAMKADVWSLGTILFQLLSGQRLCVTPDASDDIEGVLKSLANGCLAQWLAANKLGCFLRAKDLTAIENMLALNAEDRWSTSQVINCGFFAPYFRRYMITM